MANNGFTIEGDKLIITLELNSKTLSKSGKSFMLASSNGFKNIGDISVSYNVIRKKIRFGYLWELGAKLENMHIESYDTLITCINDIFRGLKLFQGVKV